MATIVCDVSDAKASDALVGATVAEFGSVDIFVNNAGTGFMMKPMLESDPDDWTKVIAVNLSGAFYCTQAAAKAMGRPGLPSDTAAACAWLVSDDAYYVTGEAQNGSDGEEMH